MNQTTSFAQDLTGKSRELLIDVQGYVIAALRLSGTWSAVLTIEGTTDGQNYDTLVDQQGVSLLAIDSNRKIVFDVSTLKKIKVRISTYTSGTVKASVLLNESGSLFGGIISIFSDVWDNTLHFFNVGLKSLIAGEDVDNHVLGTLPKPAISALYSPIAFTNFGTAAKANVKSVPGHIFSIDCQNENAAVRYLQIFNLAANPIDDSSVPLFSFMIPAGSGTTPGIRSFGREFFGEGGYYLPTGLSWGISVDPDVFDETGVTVGEHQINGTYI